MVETLDTASKQIDKLAALAADAIEDGIRELPGLTGLQRVYTNEDGTQVIWGFTCNGVPSSLTWNKTL